MAITIRKKEIDYICKKIKDENRLRNVFSQLVLDKRFPDVRTHTFYGNKSMKLLMQYLKSC